MKGASFFTKRGMVSLAMVFAITGASLPSIASASVITFDFTGLLTVTYSNGNIIPNSSAATATDPDGLRTPVAASLTYDTNVGISSTTLTITMGDFFGAQAVIHDIIPVSISGNTITATMLGDWYDPYNYFNLPIQIQWDATGLVNAASYGLQVGDKISGNSLYRSDGGGGFTLLTSSIGSAQPYSDTLLTQCYDAGDCSYLPALQDYAPLAATSGTLGFTTDPFLGIRTYLDIGSGNSMEVTSVSSVPVPAAVWLFGSGLLGLLGMARRTKAS
jgi:hypothetical protein